MHPIPNQIFDHYNAGRFQTLMGLFASVNHAWVAIDNSLFLWDYTHSEPELIGFEEQPHSISAVALVAPRPDIFTDSITHILVVATSSEIILLGVSAQDTPAGTKSVSLYQTKMSLALRGADVRYITGSADGRIFFGGSNDIDISELYYQAEEKWFSNRCGRINHTNPGWSAVVTLQSNLWSHKESEHLVDIQIDDSRNLVYTLSNLSTVRTYHMEAPNHLKLVIEKTKIHCLRDIAHMSDESSLLKDDFRIVSISPITKQEASKLHLMALTSTGCRLYFSATNTSAMLYNTKTNLAPQSMQLQFIKFPPSLNPRRPTLPGADPPLDVNSPTLKYSRHGIRFAPGYFLDFVSDGQNTMSDSLFVSAPETGKIKNTSATATIKLPESGNWIDIGSRAETVGLITAPFAAAAHPVGFGNELAVQFDEAPSEFAILTNTGIHIIRRRRFVDIFSTAIRAAAGDEGFDQVTRRFIQSYGRVETVAAALAVACGHGGDSRPGAPRAIDQMTEDRARSVFVDYGGQPTITETDTATPTLDSVKLSSRHDALGMYVSRLIRKLWKTRVVALELKPTGLLVESTVALGKLSVIQENLERLRRFLNANRGLIQGLSGPDDLQRVATRHEEVALQAEHQALHALQKLLEGISESISFVLMLFDERVVDIYARLDVTAQQHFRDLTYEKLFSQKSGKELAKVVVKAIVNRNIENGSNVETVAEALRRRCGSFCSPDDVVIFKAQEQLKRASEQPLNTNQSRKLLHESLRLFEKVAGSLAFSNLEGAVSQFVELRYYAGAVRLCLYVAHEKDRGHTALSWINDGKPASDPREAAFRERKQCYDLVHAVLLQLDAVTEHEPEKTVDGKMTLMATKRLEAYSVVNDSDDEVFHFDLYDWYIQQGWTERILAVESPHVITFLQRLATTDVAHADLLCRFYTNRSRFFDAAEVQSQLANSDFAIGIKERIKLLSMAKANASVTTVGVSRQQQQMLNHAVTELLDIANIQDDLLERLRADDRLDADRKLEISRVLDSKVQDLSTVCSPPCSH